MASLTCFVVAVVVARLAEQVVRRCYVHARLADRARGFHQEGGVGPARVPNKVGPGDPVQARVEDGLECTLGVPDNHDDHNPHRLVHVGENIVERVLPVCPAVANQRLGKKNGYYMRGGGDVVEYSRGR